MDDGTQPFGELHDGNINQALRAIMPRFGDDWDTPEWRAKMEAKYPCPDM